MALETARHSEFPGLTVCFLPENEPTVPMAPPLSAIPASTSVTRVSFSLSGRILDLKTGTVKKEGQQSSMRMCMGSRRSFICRMRSVEAPGLWLGREAESGSVLLRSHVLLGSTAMTESS